MSVTTPADHTIWSQLPLPCSPLNPTGSSALGSGCFFHLTTLANFFPQLCLENALALPLWLPACGLWVTQADRPNSLPFLHAGALALNLVEQEEGLSSQRQEFLEISQKISCECLLLIQTSQSIVNTPTSYPLRPGRGVGVAQARSPEAA